MLYTSTAVQHSSAVAILIVLVSIVLPFLLLEECLTFCYFVQKDVGISQKKITYYAATPLNTVLTKGETRHESSYTYAPGTINININWYY